MTGDPGQRIDKWLWFARFAKTRTAAQVLARSGQIRINKARNTSASYIVRIGDVLTFVLDRGVLVVRVAAMAGRRGPATEARTLYIEEISIPATKPEAPDSVDFAPLQRPGKRDRRKLLALKHRDDA